MSIWTDLADLVGGLGALDWVLLVLTLGFGIVGWVQGAVVGLLSLVGFVGGAAVGLLVVPQALDGLEPGLGTAVLAVLLVVLAAGLGYGLLSMLGEKVRTWLGVGPARRVDGLLGATLAVLGFLLSAWAVGLAVSSSGIPGLAGAARGSTVLAAIDRAVPISPDRLNATFRTVVEAGGFPQVVAPFVEEQIVAVQPPNPAPVQAPEVQRALRSVVQVAGDAPACDQVQQGSAVVVAPGRLLTNAHVVAGTTRVVVAPAGGRAVEASVVFFDPDTDVALLDAPELDLPALQPVTTPPEVGDDALVAGFPGGGGLDVGSARVRSTDTLLGLDIYGQDRVSREVVAFRGEVRPGNSGGPLLAPGGRVLGLVFAASVTDAETGYALALSELAEATRLAGVAAVTPVSTGSCIR
jgi:S1-C subfamily serine protease